MLGMLRFRGSQEEFRKNPKNIRSDSPPDLALIVEAIRHSASQASPGVIANVGHAQNLQHFRHCRDSDLRHGQS